MKSDQADDEPGRAGLASRGSAWHPRGASIAGLGTGDKGMTMGIIWEKSFIIFLFITLILGGGAAWMTGRALARGWAPFWQAALYMLLLGAAVRFFHYGLFAPPREGTLLSLHFYAVDTAILIALAWLGYQSTRATQMATQYGWLYRKTSPLTWTTK